MPFGCDSARRLTFQPASNNDPACVIQAAILIRDSDARLGSNVGSRKGSIFGSDALSMMLVVFTPLR
jgi:hypothetical protein